LPCYGFGLSPERRSFSFLPSSALWNAEPIPPGSAEKKTYFHSACPVKFEDYLTGANSASRAKRAVKNILAPTRIAKLGPPA